MKVDDSLLGETEEGTMPDDRSATESDETRFCERMRCENSPRWGAHPPFGPSATDTRWNLSAIAVEFILWDRSRHSTDGERCLFIMKAIAHNFPTQGWEATFQQFATTYQKAYAAKHHLANSEVATPRKVSELVASRPAGWGDVWEDEQGNMSAWPNSVRDGRTP